MQQPKRFQAPTMAEAYDQVRRELGDQAVILSTRKAFAPGLFGQPGRQFVEVVARVPEEASAPRTARPTLAQDKAAHELVRAIAEATAAAPLTSEAPETTTAPAMTEVPATPIETREAIPAGGVFAAFAATAAPSDLPAREVATASIAAPPVAPPPVAMDAPPAAMPTRDEALGRQLDQVRTMLEQMLSGRPEQRTDSEPAVLREMKERLARHGLAPALVAGLVTEADARDVQSLEANVARRLAAKLPPPVSVLGRRQRALFLVGPGGSGKTTLAVRMALDLQRQGLHVVIAGTDVNRAGAPQQLVAFGSVTGLDVRLCYAPGELDALLSEPGVDLVIVDTPGHNGLRRDRMAELSSFLQAARQRAVLLTVPATMKGADLAELVSAFSAVVLDGVALTRCDETAHFGHLAHVLIEAALGVAVTTRSDQVGDAPLAGDNAALAEAMVRAQWPAPAATAPRVASAAARPLAKVG